MRKLLFILFLVGIGLVSKAQSNPFPSLDSLERFINRYIRNSPVEAFQNLRLNTALIGIRRFLAESGIGAGVDTMYTTNDSTLRLITFQPDTFDVVVRGINYWQLNSTLLTPKANYYVKIQNPSTSNTGFSDWPYSTTFNKSAFGIYGKEPSLDIMIDSTSQFQIGAIVFRSNKLATGGPADKFPRLPASRLSSNAYAAIEANAFRNGSSPWTSTVEIYLGDSTGNNVNVPFAASAPGNHFFGNRFYHTAEAKEALYFGTAINRSSNFTFGSLNTFFAGNLNNLPAYMLNAPTVLADTTANKLWVRNPTTGATQQMYWPAFSTGVGTVTLVATNDGTGITGGPITSSGTVAIDTVAIIATKARLYKALDSLKNILNTLDSTILVAPMYARMGSGTPRIDTVRVRYDTTYITTRALDTALTINQTNVSTVARLQDTAAAIRASMGSGFPDPGADGYLARNGAGTYVSRTLTGTTNRISITNTTGAGNPVFNIGSEVATTNDAQNITATKTFTVDQNYNGRIVLTGVSNALRINDRSGNWITELVRDAGKFKLTAQRPDGSFHDIWSLSMIAPDNHFVFDDNGYLGLGGSNTSPTSKADILTTALGVTQAQTSGLALRNTTAAAAGAQQISPAIRWLGNGWKTNSTAASQTVEFRADVLPVQGTANPSGQWRLMSSINGGSYASALTVSSDGTVESAKLTSGTYTPTLTNVSNLDASSVSGSFHYMRIGNEVTVWGWLNMDPTSSSSNTVLRMSLPAGHTSNFAATTDAGGGLRPSTSQTISSDLIKADATNDLAEINFINGSTATDLFFIKFSYIVL